MLYFICLIRTKKLSVKMTISHFMGVGVMCWTTFWLGAFQEVTSQSQEMVWDVTPL